MSRNQKKLFQNTVFAVVSVVMNIAIFSDIINLASEILAMESRVLQVFCCFGLSCVLVTLPITLITWFKTVYNEKN